MAVAVETGVPANEWLADPRALFTAADILVERNEQAKKAGRRRG